MDKPTCFDCKNADVIGVFSGSSVDIKESPYVECKHIDKIKCSIEEFEYNKEIMPTICCHFEPILLEVCPVCKRRLINQCI